MPSIYIHAFRPTRKLACSIYKKGMVEVLLQLVVGHIDAQLLEAIAGSHLDTPRERHSLHGFLIPHPDLTPP